MRLRFTTAKTVLSLKSKNLMCFLCVGWKLRLSFSVALKKIRMQTGKASSIFPFSPSISYFFRPLSVQAAEAWKLAYERSSLSTTNITLWRILYIFSHIMRYCSDSVGRTSLRLKKHKVKLTLEKYATSEGFHIDTE